MGTAALSEQDYVHEAIEQADLIITIEHDTIEEPPFIMGKGGPSDTGGPTPRSSIVALTSTAFEVTGKKTI